MLSQTQYASIDTEGLKGSTDNKVHKGWRARSTIVVDGGQGSSVTGGLEANDSPNTSKRPSLGNDGDGNGGSVKRARGVSSPVLSVGERK